MTKIIAHRGAGGWDVQYAPENTISAFRLALEMGADAIEMDVQISRDGALVVCHDEMIDRTSDGVGAVNAYTLEELRRFNFCSVHTEYGFVEIPTLEDVLTLIKDKDILLNIELKTGLAYYPDIEKKTVDTVRAYGLTARVLYSSFNYESLLKLRAYDADARIGVLCAADYVRIPEDIHRLRAEAVHSPQAIVTGEYVEKCHTHGIAVNTWTVNNRGRMRELIAMGVDGIFTDCPDTGRGILIGEG